MSSAYSPLRRRRAAWLAAIGSETATNGTTKTVAAASGSSKFVVVVTLTTLYMLSELVVGYGFGSLVLQADAWHMLSDIAAQITGLYANEKSKSAHSYRATFGGARYDAVGGLVNSVALLALCVQIGLDSVTRLATEAAAGESSAQAHAELVLYVGAGGLVINIVGLILFGGSGQGHSHGNVSEGAERPEGGHSHSMNARGVLLHLLGDAMGSVAVIVSASIMAFTSLPGRHLADPIASLLVSIFVSASTFGLIRSSALMLLHTVPDQVDLKELLVRLRSVDGIVAIHDLHVWQLRADCIVGSMHIIVSEDDRGLMDAILDKIKLTCHAASVHSTTVQIEWMNADLLHLAGRRSNAADLCSDIMCPTTECETHSCCPPGHDLPEFHSSSTTGNYGSSVSPG